MKNFCTPLKRETGNGEFVYLVKLGTEVYPDGRINFGVGHILRILSMNFVTETVILQDRVFPDSFEVPFAFIVPV